MKPCIMIILAMLSGTALCNSHLTHLKLPSLLSDNMLLQQNTNVKIWGKATSGSNISVTASWKANGKATADRRGKWQVLIATPKAGGPYTLTISTNDTSITIKNVLVGEVWACSGQSNMEMPMTGWPPDTVMHSKTEIEKADHPDIRLFIVPRTVSDEPQDDCAGKWLVCSPASVKDFSATAYFFGKGLHEKLQEPVGLIESAWGGTPIEPWIPLEGIEKSGEFKSELTVLKDSGPKVKEYNTWLFAHQVMDVKPVPDLNKWKGLSFNDEDCALQNFDDSGWPSMKLPQKFEDVIGEFDGAIWYRRTVELSGLMADKELSLSLGPIDDMDRVYFNGQLVGATEEPGFWHSDRVYTVPSNLVKSGINTIAIRVLDNQGGGGVWGNPGQMNLTVKGDLTLNAVQLAGQWKYLPVAELIGNKFYLFDVASKGFFAKHRPKGIGPTTPTVLYNGMVHPLINYQIRGAIWYQGETSVGRADQYARLFPSMIKEWRRLWNIEDFPFYYVQIAPYEYSGKDSTESAALREAQCSALQLPNTGMAVTLDIGMVKNIHPPYKMEVGDRLSRLALANTYHVKTPYSGPVYQSMKIDGTAIKLQFDHTEGGLVAKNGDLKEFEIAGRDGKYIKANALIVNDEVVVSSVSVPDPVSVRYCWRNGAEASLFNKAGLPASVFRTQK